MSNLGQFKKYIKSANRIIDKISVTSGGAIGFSTSFSSEHELTKYTGIILYWNPADREIGIQFTATESEESLKLTPNKYGEGRTVNAKAFFATNHIDPRRYSQRFEYRVVPFSQLDPLDASGDRLYVIKLVAERETPIPSGTVSVPAPPVADISPTPAAPAMVTTLPVAPSSNQNATFQPRPLAPPEGAPTATTDTSSGHTPLNNLTP
jgi:hypothetical protein